jgi:hypothetical protein
MDMVLFVREHIGERNNPPFHRGGVYSDKLIPHCKQLLKVHSILPPANEKKQAVSYDQYNTFLTVE